METALIFIGLYFAIAVAVAIRTPRCKMAKAEKDPQWRALDNVAVLFAGFLWPLFGMAWIVGKCRK